MIALRRDPARPLFLYSALTVAAFFLLLPVFWMISTSFKKIGAVFSLPVQWIPTDPQFENYLHEQLCARAISLNDAQRRIADNWLKNWEEAGRP